MNAHPARRSYTNRREVQRKQFERIQVLTRKAAAYRALGDTTKAGRATLEALTLKRKLSTSKKRRG